MPLFVSVPRDELGWMMERGDIRAFDSKVAEDDSPTLALGRARFPDLVRDCPAVTAALVHNMIDRSRNYHSARLNDDRLESLGRLASGLAHELNNPASAEKTVFRVRLPLSGARTVR